VSCHPGIKKNKRINLYFFRLNDAVSLLRLYAIIHPESKVSEYDFNDTTPHDLIQVYN